MAGDKGGKKPPRERNRVKKSGQYTVQGDKLERKHTPCPKCGAGIFMAGHSDRESCGKCGYTKWKK
jgi:small subunit ribosomal protein S27Ae